MNRRIVIDTDKERGQLFKVSECSGRYTAYRVRIGLLFDNSTKVGEARSLEDIVTIIKTHVPGTVRNVRIDPW